MDNNDKQKRPWLPALGALIVLSTFVTKDGLRDHYKDLASTTDTARIGYKLDEQIVEQAAAIEDVRRVVERQSTPAMEQYSTFYQAWIGYEKQLDWLKELLNKVRETPDTSSAYEEIHALNGHFHESIQAFGQIARTDPTADSSELSRESGVIFSKRNVLKEKLMGEAAKEVAESEHRSTTFAYVSYFLYAIGWAVSFLGIWLKVPDVPGPV